MATEVTTEVAGKVWPQSMQSGCQVAEGDVPMLIESMKMETPVEAPCAGTLGSLLVAEGDSPKRAASATGDAATGSRVRRVR